MTNDRRTVLLIAASYGVEARGIMRIVQYLEETDRSVTIATPGKAAIQTLHMDRDPGPSVSSDAALSSVRSDAYELLVIPGGTIHADVLCRDVEAQRIVKEFAVGKTLTSFPSLRTDVNNAGGTCVDQAAVVDDTNGFALITSRTPDDMEQFTAAIGAHLQ